MNQEDFGTLLESKLSSSDTASKVKILAILAHAITVEVRGVFNENPSLCEEPLSSLNEIEHQLTARIMNLLDEKDEWDEMEFISTIYEHACQGNCKSSLDFTIGLTLKAINSNNRISE